jgi:hypothetical protein
MIEDIEIYLLPSWEDRKLLSRTVGMLLMEHCSHRVTQAAGVSAVSSTAPVLFLQISHQFIHQIRRYPLSSDLALLFMSFYRIAAGCCQEVRN